MLLRLSPDARYLERLVAEQAAQNPTYSEQGATQDPVFPAGYHHDRYEIQIGSGAGAFTRGVAGLRQWVAHTGAGVRITPERAPIERGETVVLVLPVGPVCAIAACRIVYVIDEPTRFGFGYGTLPRHPEQGEESFLVERDADDSVWFRVSAFSRPRDLLARVGAPISRRVQRRVTTGYLRAIERWTVADTQGL